MKGQIFESPRGPVLIDAQTRDIVQDIYIRKVEKSGRPALQRRVRRAEGGEGPGQGEVSGPHDGRAGRLRRPALARSCARLTDADPPLRRHRLRHAAVRAGRRAGRDAGLDELHQPRARRVRDGGRLRHGAADETRRRALPGHPAAGLPRSRRCSARCSSARCTGRCTAGRTWTRCCSRSAWCSWRSRRSTTSSARRSRTSSCPSGCRAASRSARRVARHRRYRLFIIVVCVVLALGAAMGAAHTRFGSRLRAAVDDPRVAAGLGINVNRVFLLTFAVGSGLAGLGGALGAEILGLDPTLPAQVHDLFPDRRRRRRHDARSPARCSPRCCSASPTWRASTTCPSSARSSSTC